MTESTSTKTGVVEIVESRISAIIKKISENGKLDLSVSSLAEMSDDEILNSLVSMHIETTNQDPKLIKKLKRKAAGQKKFIEYINKNGGYCTQSEYAKMTGVSRQTIANRIANNTLLAITVNGKKQIPLFQINADVTDESGEVYSEIPGLSKINKILLEKQEVGVSMSCTFWLGIPSSYDSSRRDFLVSENSSQAVGIITNQAAVVGEMRR